jgi:hypothetical protein
MRKASILAAMLAPVFSAALAAPISPQLVNLLPAPSFNHRRSASGPTNALKIRRAARKARNVKANRRNHRG